MVYFITGEFVIEIFSLGKANSIGGVIVIVLAPSAVDRGFDPRSGQTKDYKSGICCFSAKYAALRRKNTDWLARNQGNVSKWRDMSIHGLFFQLTSTIKIQLSTKRTSSSCHQLHINCFIRMLYKQRYRSDINWQISNNQHYFVWVCHILWWRQTSVHWSNGKCFHRVYSRTPDIDGGVS